MLAVLVPGGQSQATLGKQQVPVPVPVARTAQLGPGDGGAGCQQQPRARSSPDGKPAEKGSALLKRVEL